MASSIWCRVHGFPQPTGQPVEPNCSSMSLAGWCVAGPVGYMRPAICVSLPWCEVREAVGVAVLVAALEEVCLASVVLRCLRSRAGAGEAVWCGGVGLG